MTRHRTEPASMHTATMSRTTKIVLSVLLVFHLAAVFLPPFQFASSNGAREGSPFASMLGAWLTPYVDAMYLDHGYFFFAPNPGPSHLLEARLQFADGRAPTVIRLPDADAHWSRLLYHRHFMLSEQLNMDLEMVQLEPPAEIVAQPDALAMWQRARSMNQQRWRAVRDHLKSHYSASEVQLTRLRHRLVSPGEFVSQEMTISSPETFETLPDPETGATRGGDSP